MSAVRRRPLALAGLALLAVPVVAGCRADAPRALTAVPVTPSAAATASPAPAQVRAQQVAPPVTARPRPAGPAPRPAATHAATRVRTALPTHRAVAPQPAPTRAPAAAPRPKPAGTTTTSGDAYPWRDSAGTANDPWGFTERQCVSYAAWRLAQAGRTISNSQGWGSALNWDDNARRLGRTVSSTPRVGAVAQWNAGESSQVWVGGSSTPNGTFAAGSYGHVAYVTAVYADGSVQVSQYNATGSRTYSSMRLRAPRYLYL